MSTPIRPQFFCARPNGTLTPLIAVDELPAHIVIHNAPRVLSAGDTHGMTSLGTVSAHGNFYNVEGTSLAPSRPSSAGITGHRSRTYDLQASLMRILSDENISGSQRLALTTLLQQGIPQIWHVNSAPAPAAGWLVPNSGSSPGGASGRQNLNLRNIKKEYCSYWIRHGECDYQQQGCLYKHEMPQERSMLEKLGLRDIPRWYREKHNMTSILPNGHGHPRPNAENGHGWKEDGTTFKSIQYPIPLGISRAEESIDLEKGTQQRAAAHLPTQQHPQVSMLPGSSQVAYQPLSSPIAPIHGQTLKTSHNQIDSGSKKIDFPPFGRPDYGMLYHPSNERNSFETPGKSLHEDLVRNHLQTLALNTPISTSVEYPAAPFEAAVGAGRSKNMQKSRRLYQVRPDTIHDNGPDMLNNDSLHAFQSHPAASSSGASVTSKTTGSQLASPMADATHGGIMSAPPTRDPSPTSLSGGSPVAFRGRANNKNFRRAPGAIGTKKNYRKLATSVGPFEDDLFYHLKK
ncbi:hypothetical protein BJX99DRAFT_267599 [Aspergillus californicus]